MKHHVIGLVSRRRTLRLGGLLLLASTAALAVACSGQNNPTSPSAVGVVSPGAESPATASALLPGGESSSTLAAAKTMVCHRTPGTYEFVVISVAESALQSHLDHGDPPYTAVSLASATFSSSGNLTPASFAFDGNLATAWGAGGPPVQYIEVDFGSPQSFWAIAALVDQSPSGTTSHQVSLDGSLGFSWNGYTSNGDRLTHRFASVQTARKVRVTTTVSPSWVAWRDIWFPPCPLS